ncbi:MAG: hypothetical protein ACT4PZ_14650 [Panacagrimonas sp.]
MPADADGIRQGCVTAALFEHDHEEIQQEMKAAEAECRSALQNHAKAVEWRSSVIHASLADYVAREARRADFVITGAAAGDLFDASRASTRAIWSCTRAPGSLRARSHDCTEAGTGGHRLEGHARNTANRV